MKVLESSIRINKGEFLKRFRFRENLQRDKCIFLVRNSHLTHFTTDMPQRRRRSEKKERPLKVSTRDPRIPYHFTPLPRVTDDEVIWDGFSIKEIGPKGSGLFLNKLSGGLLIPMGGEWIEAGEFIRLQGVRRPCNRIDYIITDSVLSGYFDGHPDLEPKRFAWPGTKINEATAGTSEAYNCSLVLLKRSDYPDMPHYPFMDATSTYAFFIEVEVTHRSTESASDGQVEALCHYQWRPAALGKRKVRGYIAKDPSLLSSWKPVDGADDAKRWFKAHYRNCASVACHDAVDKELGTLADNDEVVRREALAQARADLLREMRVRRGELLSDGRVRPPSRLGARKASNQRTCKRKYKSK